MMRHCGRTMRRIGICLISLSALASIAEAQQDKLLDEIGVAGSVLDESPFDVITLKKEHGGRSVRVGPIDFPGRKIPQSPKDSDRFRVSFSLFPDRIYEIVWRDIEKVILFEELVLQRANTLLEQKKFSEAFEHLDFLMKNYPQMAGLSRLRRDFLYKSALEVVGQRRLPHALGVLEEFLRMFPQDEKKDIIKNAISNVSSQLVDSYFKANDFATARAMIIRLEKDYIKEKEPLPVVSKWKGEFLEMATGFRDLAIQHRDAGDYSKARQAAMRMLAIEPDIEGGKKFLNELILAYPMIRVGVFQTSDKPDTSSLADWPSSRIGQLISNPLFEFRNTGPEGGKYDFRYGAFQQNDDRTELDLMIKNPGKDTVPDSLALSQAFLDRATVGNANYVPGWASIVDSVSVFGPEKLKLKLRRPHVLPQAFLQWQMDNKNTQVTKSRYRLKSSEAGLKRFEWADINPPADYQPKEIQEILYSDPQKAVLDLIKGDIEMIDRLFPADANRLRTVTSVTTDQYALPMVHMLIPRTSNPYMDNPEFRRALLYAINREGILNGEILGKSDSNVSRVISGPFPYGATDADHLAYAYNKSIDNFAYDPRNAKVLLMLTKSKLASQAEKRKETLKPIPTIRLGVPNYESAKVAGEAIIQAWKLIELPAELVILQNMPKPNEESNVDFIYVSAAVWEPATDAERLFGTGGPAQSNNQFIVYALEQLNNARNWREVRQGCQDLHALVAAHLPILPLWQVGETFAYRKEAIGIAKKPTGLYQDVQKWRFQVR